MIFRKRYYICECGFAFSTRGEIAEIPWHTYKRVSRREFEAFLFSRTGEFA